MKSILSKTLLTMSLLVATVAGQDVLDGIAAVVGNKIILRSDILQLANMAAMQQRISLQQPGVLEALQGQALEQIITQNVYINQARIDSLDEIAPAQVEQTLDQQMDQIMAQVGSEEKFFEVIGQTVRNFRRERWDSIRDQLIAEQFQNEKIKSVTISRPEVVAFFEAYKDSLPPIDTRAEISQMAIPIEPGDEAKSITLEQIETLRERILAGGDFATLAGEFSEDPGSKVRGGELGFVRRGDLVPAFEKAAFALGPHEMSEVVESVFGYHIIKMIEKQGEKLNVRHILLKPKANAEDRERALNTVRETYFVLVDHPEEFDSLAMDILTEAKGKASSPYVGWVEAAQLPSEAYRTALFGSKKGEITPPFETPEGFHILKIHDIIEGGPTTLDGYYPQIESIALRRKQAQYLETWLARSRKDLFIRIL